MNGKRPGAWVALAVRWYRDPKFEGLSAEAIVLWLNALCYCGEQETDGRVPRSQLLTLCYRGTQRPVNVARSLVKAGLWIETGDGFAFPFETYSRWQPTAEQKREQRAKTAEKVSKWRARNQVGNRGSNRPSGVGVVRSTTPLDKPELEGVEARVWEENGQLWAALPSPPREGGT